MEEIRKAGKKFMYKTVAGSTRHQLAGVVDSSTYKGVVALADRQRISISALVRKAVMEYLERNTPPSRSV